MDRLDDVAVYRRLIALCDDLSELADQCWSPTTGRVVTWLAHVTRRLAELLQQRQAS